METLQRQELVDYAESIMSKLPTLKLDAYLLDSLIEVNQNKCGALPVCDSENRPVGILKENFVLEHHFEIDEDTIFDEKNSMVRSHEHLVNDVMDEEFLIINSSYPVNELLTLFNDTNETFAIVVDNKGKYLGMVFYFTVQRILKQAS